MSDQASRRYQLLIRNLRKKNDEKTALRKAGVVVLERAEGSAGGIPPGYDGDHRRE